MTLVPITSRQAYKDSKGIVTVSNTNYKTFKSFTISRSIDNVCGEFEIVLSRPENSQSPFRQGDTIDIQLDGFQVMRGIIYTTGLSGDASADNIVLKGRDTTADLIDSTVPDDSKVYVAGVNIFDIATSIIDSKGLGEDIAVINQTGGVIAPFTEEEIVSCSTGDTVIEFLQKYCRKRQLFLTTDNHGNLVFFKADGIRTGNSLINQFNGDGNNVITYDTTYSIADRFSRYICKSQNSDAWEDLVVDAVGSASDIDISSKREFEFKMEEGSVDDVECRGRAAEEANVRRARGFRYEVTVQGFKDNTTWGIDQFVNVVDEKSGISGEFLVEGVEYRLDNLNGSTTRLVVVNRDAYTAQAAIDLRTSKLSDAGIGWTND